MRQNEVYIPPDHEPLFIFNPYLFRKQLDFCLLDMFYSSTVVFAMNMALVADCSVHIYKYIYRFRKSHIPIWPIAHTVIVVLVKVNRFPIWLPDSKHMFSLGIHLLPIKVSKTQHRYGVKPPTLTLLFPRIF